MMPMPPSTTAMQIQVRRPTGSRISSQPSRPAKNGAAAWMNMMLATVVYSSAKMKQLEAVAKQQATTIPAQPKIAKRLDHMSVMADRDIDQQREASEAGTHEQLCRRLSFDHAAEQAAGAPDQRGGGDQHHAGAVMRLGDDSGGHGGRTWHGVLQDPGMICAVALSRFASNGFPFPPRRC